MPPSFEKNAPNSVPTNNKFGYAGINEEKLRLTWSEVLEEMLTTIKSRTEKTQKVP